MIQPRSIVKITDNSGGKIGRIFHWRCAYQQDWIVDPSCVLAVADVLTGVGHALIALTEPGVGYRLVDG